MTTRRSFVKKSGIFLSASSIMPFSVNKRENKFRMCLNPGNIGASYNQKELLDIAIKYGFNAIAPFPDALAKMSNSELDDLLTIMKDNEITWGSAGLPIEFRKDNARYDEDLKQLPSTAAALKRAGGTRMNTWIMPSHPHLTYRENFEQHKKRLKAAANILGHYDIRLGLEYVGPKTLLTRSKYSFVRTMAEGKELIEAMGESNVGFVMDSFHWYCAGDTKADLLTLENKDIVVVDLNDARSDLSVDDQIDNTRELPMATGVIPLKDFMDALLHIGYDGPFRAEPFNQPLRDMEDEEAVKATYMAMKKAFELV